MNKKEFSLSEAEIIINETIASNAYNRKHKGATKNLALRFVGPKGIGKTELPLGLAKAKGYATKYMNVSEMTDESAIYGFPRDTYSMSIVRNEVTEEGKTVKRKYRRDVRTDRAGEFEAKGWKYETKTPQMTHSKPAWVDELSKTEHSILILDEFSRALSHVSQSLMNLVLLGRFGSWSLPKGCQIILLDNPDDGEYNVNSLDEAQLDRAFTYNLKPDVDSWVKWASGAGIHEECINFLYKTDEARDYSTEDHDSKVKSPSYRMWTNFFQRISHIDNLNDPNKLPEIQRAGVGSVGEDMLRIFKLFTDNQLGMLPSLSKTFSSDTKIETALREFRKAITDQVTGNIRHDIKGLLGLRLVGYMSNAKNLKTDFFKKFDALVGENIISKDILMRIVTNLRQGDGAIYGKIVNNCPAAFEKLMEVNETV